MSHSLPSVPGLWDAGLHWKVMMHSEISACILGQGLAGIGHSRAKPTFSYTHLSSQACSAEPLLPACLSTASSGFAGASARRCLLWVASLTTNVPTQLSTRLPSPGTGCSMGTTCSCWGWETRAPWCLWPGTDFLVIFSVWRPIWAWVAFESLVPPTSKDKALLYWAKRKQCG